MKDSDNEIGKRYDNDEVTEPQRTPFPGPTPRDLLVYFRLWLEGHLRRVNGSPVCQVGEWEMQQRLAELNAVLARFPDDES